MTATYLPLATITLISTDSEIVFSSIPATYRDLVLVINARYTSLDGNIQLRFNGDGGSNYSSVYFGGNGSSPFAGTLSLPWIYGGGANTSQGNGQIFQIMDYAQSKHKTVLNRTSEVGGAVYAWANRWASTNAINTISIVGQDALRTFAIGSTFSLYGIN